MQTIAEMITAAQERQSKKVAALEAQKEQRRQEDIAELKNRLIEIFGELPAMLGVSVEAAPHETVRAVFSYRDRPYRLSEGRNDWFLTRIEERAEGDDRDLPLQDFYATYRNGIPANQDNFLLALAELSERPDTPRRTATVVREAPEPTIEERLVEVLRAFIQAEAPNNY